MIKRLRAGILGTILSFGIMVNAPLVSLLYSPAIPVASVVAVTLVTSACNKDQLAASAQDVLDVITSPSLQAYLQTVSPSALTRLLSLVGPAKNLVAAIKSGDINSAIGLVNIIGPAVDDIAQVLNASPQQLALIGLANLALHFIVNHVKANMPTHAAITPAMRQAIEYASKRAWGCDYHKNDKRCH